MLDEDGVLGHGILGKFRGNININSVLYFGSFFPLRCVSDYD